MTYGEEMVDEQSFPYTFTLNNEGTYAVEAIAYLNGESSESLTGNIIIAIPKPGAPVFEPASNAEGIEVAGGTQVKVSYPQGAVLNISLKKDDADVALDVNGANPFVYTLEDEAIYEFSATATHNGKTSDIVNASYIVTFPTLDAPVITPASGTITLGEAVTFTCAEGASMKIDIMDSEANITTLENKASGFEWTPTAVGPYEITAKATQKYHKDSAAASASITVALPQVATPVITPSEGNLHPGDVVTFTCETERAQLYITDADEKPIASGVNSGFTWTASALGNYVFWVTAKADGMRDSELALAEFTVVEAPKTVSAMVIMNDQTFNYGNGMTVTWTSETVATDPNSPYTFETSATVSVNSNYPVKYDGNLRLYRTSNNILTVKAPEGYKFVSVKAKADKSFSLMIRALNRKLYLI